MQAQRALNPLFLRDAELERSLALLALLQLDLGSTVGDVLARTGLEGADLALLARLDGASGGRQPVTAAELAHYFGWTKQRMSRRLQQLAGSGLIERSAVEGDRRKRTLAPTEAGSRLVAEALELQKRWLRRVFRRAGAADVAGFQHVLQVAAQISPRGARGLVPVAVDDAASGA
ncbi:MAG: MarR family winged helix-turn-helix transcriptional regulator [Geminicoccaceae bacterium]